MTHGGVGYWLATLVWIQSSAWPVGEGHWKRFGAVSTPGGPWQLLRVAVRVAAAEVGGGRVGLTYAGIDTLEHIEVPRLAIATALPVRAVVGATVRVVYEAGCTC